MFLRSDRYTFELDWTVEGWAHKKSAALTVVVEVDLAGSYALLQGFYGSVSLCSQYTITLLMVTRFYSGCFMSFATKNASTCGLG